MVIPNQPFSREASSHRLLEGYTGKAKLLWGVLLALGIYVVLQAAQALLLAPRVPILVAALSVALAGLCAAFPIRLGKRSVAYSFGDFYLLFTLCAIGPNTAILAAAVEGYVGTRMSSKRLSSRIVSPAIQATCMFVAGQLYASLTGAQGFSSDSLPVVMLVAFISALAFSVAQLILVSAIPALNRRARPDLIMAGAYVTSTVVTAVVASTIAFTFRDSLATAMVVSIPVVAAIIGFAHVFRRHFQQTLESQRREADAWKQTASQTAEYVHELRAREQRLNVAFQDAAVGAALLKPDGTILQVNHALCQLLQRAASLLVGTNLADHIAAADRDLWRRHLRRAEVDSASQFSVELRFDNDGGRTVWLGAHCSEFSDPRAGLRGLVLHAHDNTERHEAELRLRRIADYDALTGLPNQRRSRERLAELMDVARSDPTQGVALMFVDFDGFKAINDRFGHAAGDEFLVEMARRMCLCVRPGDLVGRLGGDEFMILVRTSETTDRNAIAALARRIIDNAAAPYDLSGTQVSASMSIGIAVDTASYGIAQHMIEDADKAMYAVKAAGKRNFAFADDRLDPISPPGHQTAASG